MKTAITSGGAGDILFSIPVMKALGVDTLLIKESFYPPGFGSLYSSMKDLMQLQGFKVLPTKDEGFGFDRFEAGVKYDINMDAWRSCRMRGQWHIMQSMLNHWRVSQLGRPWQRPWLKIDDKPSVHDVLYSLEEYAPSFSLFSLTPRWRESDCDWRRVMDKHTYGIPVFVGFDEDHADFQRLIGHTIYHYPTPTFLDVVRLVRDAKDIYCNQGFVLAAAQALGKNYWCAFKKGKTNCLTRTSNEHYL